MTFEENEGQRSDFGPNLSPYLLVTDLLITKMNHPNQKSLINPECNIRSSQFQIGMKDLDEICKSRYLTALYYQRLLSYSKELHWDGYWLLIKVKNFSLEATKNSIMTPKEPISMYFWPFFHLHPITRLYYQRLLRYSKELHWDGLGYNNLT